MLFSGIPHLAMFFCALPNSQIIKQSNSLISLRVSDTAPLSSHQMTSDNPVTDTLVTGLLATRRAREAPVRHRIHHLFPAAKKRTAAAVIQIFTYLPRPKNSRFEKNHRLIEQHLAPALGLRLRPVLMFGHLLSCLHCIASILLIKCQQNVGRLNIWIQFNF